MSEIMDKILDGIKSIAPLAANVVLPGSGTLVEGLMRSVTGDKPETPIDEVAARISADPALMVQLQEKAMEHEARLADIEARKLVTVNQTMQAESQSEKWPQYSWRPFNGFCFPTAVILIYFVLPICAATVPDVPYWVWAGWLSILGVATWDRGKEKRVKAGDSNSKTGIIEGAIKALRG